MSILHERPRASLASEKKSETNTHTRLENARRWSPSSWHWTDMCATCEWQEASYHIAFEIITLVECLLTRSHLISSVNKGWHWLRVDSAQLVSSNLAFTGDVMSHIPAQRKRSVRQRLSVRQTHTPHQTLTELSATSQNIRLE